MKTFEEYKNSEPLVSEVGGGQAFLVNLNYGHDGHVTVGCFTNMQRANQMAEQIMAKNSGLPAMEKNDSIEGVQIDAIPLDSAQWLQNFNFMGATKTVKSF